MEQRLGKLAVQLVALSLAAAVWAGPGSSADVRTPQVRSESTLSVRMDLFPRGAGGTLVLPAYVTQRLRSRTEEESVRQGGGAVSKQVPDGAGRVFPGSRYAEEQTLEETRLRGGAEDGER